MREASAPAGFLVEREGAFTIVVRASAAGAIHRSELARPGNWERLIAEGSAGSGRGPTASCTLPDGTSLILKTMHRGGWLGRLWNGRYTGSGRLLENLRVAHEAIRRGVRTPSPVALLLRKGPPGWVRAWLATEAIAGAENLSDRIQRDPPPGRPELGAAMRAVRAMHDAGVEHRDLNLGNVLLLRAEKGEPEVFFVDLDRARLHDGPLSFRHRQAAIRRMERSYVKRFGDRGPLGDGARDCWYDLYAGNDGGMAARLRRGRLAGRTWLLLHRLAWRR